MKKTGVAIVGCGTIFPMHARAVCKADNTELLLVVDIDREKAESAAVKYGCRYDTDYKSILQDSGIEAVHLCTPHYLHGPMAKELLQSGKHVLTEKPMGINIGECMEMNRISQKSTCQLGVCFQNRYHDTCVKVKKMIDDQSLGRVLGARAFVTWMRNEEYYTQSPWRGTWEKEGGSLLMNQSIHTLDLLQWFLGDIGDVSGSVATHLLSGTIETEDTAEALISFQSGARALFYATNNHIANAPVFIEVLCEQGSMSLSGDLVIQYKDGRSEIVQDQPSTGAKSYWGTGHKNLIQHFYSCIRKKTPFPVSGTEGIKSIEIIDRLYSSGNS